MKKTMIALTLISSLSQAINNTEDVAMSTLSPTLMTMVSSGAFDKQVLELAQEDAAQYVASKGQMGATPALKAAVEEVQAKLLNTGISLVEYMQGVQSVLIINRINSQK